MDFLVEGDLIRCPVCDREFISGYFSTVEYCASETHICSMSFSQQTLDFCIDLPFNSDPTKKDLKAIIIQDDGETAFMFENNSVVIPYSLKSAKEISILYKSVTDSQLFI